MSMISFETYQKIQELHELGVPNTKIAKRLGVTEHMVARWAAADDAMFYELHNTRFRYLEQYKAFCSSRSAPARR